MIIGDNVRQKSVDMGLRPRKNMYGWVGFFSFGPHTPVTFLDKYPPGNVFQSLCFSICILIQIKTSKLQRQHREIDTHKQTKTDPLLVVLMTILFVGYFSFRWLFLFPLVVFLSFVDSNFFLVDRKFCFRWSVFFRYSCINSLVRFCVQSRIRICFR